MANTVLHVGKVLEIHKKAGIVEGPSVRALPSVSLGPNIKMHIKNVRPNKYITDPQ